MLLNTSRSLTDQELLRYTGQTAVRDVQTATRQLAQAEDAVCALSARLRQHDLSLLSCFLRRCTTVVTTESDHADALILAAVLALPATFSLIAAFHPSLLVTLAFCFATVGLLYGLFFGVLRTRPDELGQDRHQIRKERWRSFFRDRKLMVVQLDALRKELAQKRRLIVQLRKAARRAYEIEALLATDLQTLSGLQFEEFLERVFAVLGYPEVVRTKASGDQGIDLIVGNGQERIAVQAKLYQGAVGNQAVQQAFAGMAHYGCDRCAVVTNSVFTRSAVELAVSTGCKLIDGQRLRRIIAGQEPL